MAAAAPDKPDEWQVSIRGGLNTGDLPTGFMNHFHLLRRVRAFGNGAGSAAAWRKNCVFPGVSLFIIRRPRHPNSLTGECLA